MPPPTEPRPSPSRARRRDYQALDMGRYRARTDGALSQRADGSSTVRSSRMGGRSPLSARRRRPPDSCCAGPNDWPRPLVGICDSGLRRLLFDVRSPGRRRSARWRRILRQPLAHHPLSCRVRGRRRSVRPRSSSDRLRGRAKRHCHRCHNPGTTHHQLRRARSCPSSLTRAVPTARP
jgi:hypothetical protein